LASSLSPVSLLGPPVRFEDRQWKLNLLRNDRSSSSSSSSELHCQSCNAQSLYPLVHFISLSLSDLFWLPAHAPCLLYYSSPQSCTVRAATLRVRHFPPKPLEELHRCSSSMCDHFVRDSARVPLPLTVTVQHRLLPRANVSRMYAECFDKVLYHVNSRILKCKMTNVITRVCLLRQLTKFGAKY
jgi:hypothetical protein